jgi:hypothetical protein
MMDAPPFSDSAPSRKRLSKGAKIGIGCGVAAGVMIVVVCAGVIVAAIWGFNKVNAFAREFEQKGYVRVQGQVIEVTQPVSTPTVYTCQVVKIKSDVNADVAIMCQVAEVYSTIDGDVEFFGQSLTIRPEAVITGDLKVRGAQVVDIQGRVDGQVSGNYQAITRRPAK